METATSASLARMRPEGTTRIRNTTLLVWSESASGPSRLGEPPRGAQSSASESFQVFFQFVFCFAQAVTASGALLRLDLVERHMQRCAASDGVEVTKSPALMSHYRSLKNRHCPLTHMLRAQPRFVTTGLLPDNTLD